MLVVLAAVAWVDSAAAQTRSPAPANPGRAAAPGVPPTLAWTSATLRSIGSAAEDRARLAQLLGRDSTRGFLLRSASLSALPPAPAGGAVVAGILPELLVVRNSRIPSADNDGALWAGRGASMLVRGGAALRAGRVVAVFAPEVAYAHNRGFASVPSFLDGQQPPTGPFAAQWFTGDYSADLPIRFGDQSYTVLGFGQSSVGVAAGRIVAGVSTENQWWGPGVRNALLTSNAAEGVPHLFVRTARPLRTRVGEVEARWLLGRPTRSLYFRPPADVADVRSLSGGVVTLRAAAEPGLTVGVARLVLAPLRGGLLAHGLDVLTKGGSSRRADQLTSVFARWVVPDAGAEIYGEFARSQLPRSLREFLVAPLNTGAYTLGVADAWRGPRGGTMRGSLEVTNLEQSRTLTDRPGPFDYYTGRAAPAGFTSRGQPLGAAIGPGSQSQWAALDYFASGWDAGLFAQRVRYQNDAFYRVFVTNLFRHDVALAGGLRGGVRRGGVDTRATLTFTRRLNYLFQNGTYNYLGLGSVDVRNVTLGFSLAPSPRAPARR